MNGFILLLKRGLVSDIEDAFMESNGQLIVIQKNDENYSNLLVSEGKIMEDNLVHIGKNDEWLKEELAKYNVLDINDIFLVEYSNDDKLFIVKK